MNKVSLPEDDSERAEMLMADGLLDYFPNALAEIARHSKAAGDKHHPGEPLHWERSKSTDHRNKIVRHLIDSGKKDNQGHRHSTGLAWRALALLQEELEKEYGYPTPRGAVDEDKVNAESGGCCGCGGCDPPDTGDTIHDDGGRDWDYPRNPVLRHVRPSTANFTVAIQEDTTGRE